MYNRSKIIVRCLCVLSIIFVGFYLKNHFKTKDNLLDNSFNVGLDTKIATLDPRIIGLDANTQYIEELLFLPLISFDKNGERKNVLVENIKDISNIAWNIKLKKGILFNSGQEITAADVIATYLAIIHPRFGFPLSPRAMAFKNIDEFKQLSTYELFIKLKHPDASFLNNLVIGILPKSAANYALPNDIIAKAYESGPFILINNSSNNILLRQNPRYNFSNPAKLAKINFKIIPDVSTRYAALIKGDIDFLQNSLDPDKIAMIKNKMPNKFKILQKTKLATTYLGINFRNVKLQNLLIRKAIASALDIKSILKYRLHSEEEIATSMFPPNFYYFAQDIPAIKFDPIKSRMLMERSGIHLPLNLSLKASSSNRLTIDVAKAIAANLNAVGFKIRLDILENSIFQEHLRLGLAQLWIAPWTGFKDPDHLRFVFASDMQPPNGANRGAYTNHALDSLLSQGQVELKPMERKKIYAKAQKIIYADLPYIFLWHGDNIAIMSNKISNYEPYADGRYWSFIDVKKN